MGLHLEGFKPADEKWHKMRKIWDACREAGVAVPEEVALFFEDTEPDPSGVRVNDMLILHGIREYAKSPVTRGFEIDLREIPPDIKILRVYVSE